MSTPFTDPLADGFDALFLDTANEFFRAYSERRQAISQSATNLQVEFADATLLSKWATMQQWIIDNCTSFVNYDGNLSAGDFEGIGPDSSGSPVVLTYANAAEFYSVAGMNTSGFRRAVTWSGVGDPAFSFGVAVPGDIFGWWIYDDLIKAFSALRWTNKVEGDSGVSKETPAGGGSHTGSDTAGAKSCADTVIAQNVAWGASSWALSSTKYYSASATHVSGHSVISATRLRAYPTLTIPDHVPAEVDVYFILSFLGGSSFRDLDSLFGTVNPQELWFHETWAEVTDSTGAGLADRGGSTEATRPGAAAENNNPWPLSTFTCPLSGTAGESAELAEASYVIKWNFTNQTG